MVKKVERQRGDDHDHLFQVLDGDYAAIPLTTETFRLTINSEENPTDDTNQLYTVLGSIVEASTGKISFVLTGTLDIGNYFFDIQMTDTAGKKRTIAKGQWNIIQDITKV